MNPTTFVHLPIPALTSEEATFACRDYTGEKVQPFVSVSVTDDDGAGVTLFLHSEEQALQLVGVAQRAREAFRQHRVLRGTA